MQDDAAGQGVLALSGRRIIVIEYYDDGNFVVVAAAYAVCAAWFFLFGMAVGQKSSRRVYRVSVDQVTGRVVTAEDEHGRRVYVEHDKKARGENGHVAAP